MKTHIPPVPDSSIFSLSDSMNLVVGSSEERPKSKRKVSDVEERDENNSSLRLEKIEGISNSLLTFKQLSTHRLKLRLEFSPLSSENRSFLRCDRVVEFIPNDEFAVRGEKENEKQVSEHLLPLLPEQNPLNERNSTLTHQSSQPSQLSTSSSTPSPHFPAKSC